MASDGPIRSLAVLHCSRGGGWEHRPLMHESPETQQSEAAEQRSFSLAQVIGGLSTQVGMDVDRWRVCRPLSASRRDPSWSHRAAVRLPSPRCRSRTLRLSRGGRRFADCTNPTCVRVPFEYPSQTVVVGTLNVNDQ
jgi:hypothetical protein